MNPNFDKPFTFDRVIRILLFIAIGLTLFFLLKKLSGVILPFMIAWLLAYMIYPLVKFFQYKLKIKYRSVSIILALLTIITITSLLISALIPIISEEVKKMTLIITEFINNNYQLNTMIVPAEWQEWFKKFMIAYDFENAFSAQNVIQVAKKISPQFWSFITSSFSFLISMMVVFVVILYVFFILLDYEKLSDEWIKMIPDKYRVFVSHLAKDLETGMNKYFRSQALIALIVGVLFAIGFKIIGLPLGIILGLFIGMLNIVPYLQIVGLLPMTFLVAIKAIENNENFFLVFLSAFAVMAIVQIIQDTLLVPKIMGKTTGLNPAVILLSLSIWGALLGVVGMIIALPITTLLISYYKRYILWERVEKKKRRIKKDTIQTEQEPLKS